MIIDTKYVAAGTCIFENTLKELSQNFDLAKKNIKYKTELAYFPRFLFFITPKRRIYEFRPKQLQNQNSECSYSDSVKSKKTE